MKWAPGIEIEPEIAENIKNAQRSQTGGTNAWLDADENGFPDNYDFTMTFPERGDDGAVGSSYEDVSSDTEFNNAITSPSSIEGSNLFLANTSLGSHMLPTTVYGRSFSHETFFT